MRVRGRSWFCLTPGNPGDGLLMHSFCPADGLENGDYSRIYFYLSF